MVKAVSRKQNRPEAVSRNENGPTGRVGAAPPVETERGLLAEEVGFEPTRAGSQPLTVFKTGRISHSRILPKLVEKVGIEPTTIRLQGGRSPN